MRFSNSEGARRRYAGYEADLTRRARAPRATPWAALGTALLLALLAAPGGASEECLECHDTDAERLEVSVHGGFGCLDCHRGADDPDHPDAVSELACADCHEDAVAEFATSAHGTRALALNGDAMDCATCHGAIHSLVPAADSASPLHSLRQAKTCGGCHSDPERARSSGLRLVRPLSAYLGGVHARALVEGKAAPTCGDCHGSHAILPGSHPGSRVHAAAEPTTCGGCHESIALAYVESIHGEAAAAGIDESPSCTDCHGEHRILGPDNPASPVFPSSVPRMTCGRCHGDLRLAEKFGLPVDRMGAYGDSYHGLASEAGVTTVAQCASCHGVHDIRPSSDPRSHTHPERLAETCGACHPGAGRRFALGPIHVVPGGEEHWTVALARELYLWLIVLVIGGMLIHNLLDLRRKAHWKPPPAPPRPSPEPRMPPLRRAAHGVLMVSFTVLVYTGFALLEPEAWWAAPIARLEGAYGLRGGIHRAAALAMLVAGGLHLLDLVRHRRARADLRALVPGREDLRELRERVRFWRGRRPSPPHGGRYGYPEKLEYWAVVWGSLVMAATGFALWFENLVLRWLPKWTLDLATTIHLYEAILATLAILVWHFYFVIFDPAVYPMDTAWWTGRSTPGREAERVSDPVA